MFSGERSAAREMRKGLIAQNSIVCLYQDFWGNFRIMGVHVEPLLVVTALWLRGYFQELCHGPPSSVSLLVFSLFFRIFFSVLV